MWHHFFPSGRSVLCCAMGGRAGRAALRCMVGGGRIGPARPSVVHGYAVPTSSLAALRCAVQGMARTLAALHSVDPRAVGLEGYGKPSGYNRRQVWRWGQQYLKSVQVREDDWCSTVAVAVC